MTQRSAEAATDKNQEIVHVVFLRPNDKGRQLDAAARYRIRSRSGLFEQLLDIFPVHEMVDKRLEIIGAAVAIVDVVGMLPDIAAEDRRRAMDQRAFTIRGLGDFQLAVLDRKPAPARAELADTGSGEIGLELVETAEILGDLLFELAGQLAAAAVRLHPVPEMQVVVVLAGVIEDRRVLAERPLDDLFEGFAFEFGSLDRVVAVGHVGLMMLVMMEFQRLLRHVRRQGVMSVRQVGEREGHGLMSAIMGGLWETLTGTLIEGSIAVKHRNLGRPAPIAVGVCAARALLTCRR